MMPRPTSLVVLVAFTLAGCAEPTSPHATLPHAQTRANLARVVDNSTFPVEFSIPGGTCGLTSTVTGTGVFHAVTHASQSKTGEWTVAFNWDAHGTASGADGSQYRFNYAVSAKWIDPVSPTTLPVVLNFADHFNLLGQGQAPDVKIFLKGQFLFDGVTITPVGDPVIRGGPLTCDPI
jgi:hypothetical protein